MLKKDGCQGNRRSTFPRLCSIRSNHASSPLEPLTLVLAAPGAPQPAPSDRRLTARPQQQEYFPHFDLCPGSKDIRHHGQKVVKALDSALKHLDNLHDTLADLSDLHAYNLRVDPVNFKLLAKCFHVTLASQLRAEYNPLVYLAWDKFFHQVACCLSEKYR
uniref:Globin domain-containing protein n=1 Tax=Salvator merianae TaxID=96440 RepID=A0A8D0BI44_SALMN